jgi:hypothetical protein
MLGAHRRGKPGPGADGRKLERRKNGARFPVLAANHQRFVLQGVAVAAGGSGTADEAKQKGRHKAGLFNIWFGAAKLSTSISTWR